MPSLRAPRPQAHPLAADARVLRVPRAKTKAKLTSTHTLSISFKMVLGTQCGCRRRTERTEKLSSPGPSPGARLCVALGCEGARAGRVRGHSLAERVQQLLSQQFNSTRPLTQGFPAVTPAAGLPCPGCRGGERWGPSTCTTAQPRLGKARRPPGTGT